MGCWESCNPCDAPTAGRPDRISGASSKNINGERIGAGSETSTITSWSVSRRRRRICGKGARVRPISTNSSSRIILPIRAVANSTNTTPKTFRRSRGRDGLALDAEK